MHNSSRPTRSLHGPQGHRPGSRPTDFQAQHHIHDGYLQIRPPSHAPRLRYHQLRFRRRLRRQPLPQMPSGYDPINSAYVEGDAATPTMVDYSATKGAISSFTRTLAQQQAPKGIRVNSVAPGIIWTPLQPATKGNDAKTLEGLGSTTSPPPLGRPGMPVEVAVAFIFLATSTYTTGETVHVTGAMENQG